MNKLILIAGGSTAVYLVLALLMGVLPGIELSKTTPGAGVTPLTALQAQGRDVYAANGCAYCHTQQVRPLEQDKIFGRPTAASDLALETPELLGSERTGPDLTNVGARQSSDIWQYIHLYNPRAVVPESIMPSFPWMFEVVDKAPEGVPAVPLPAKYAPVHGVMIPSGQARALVAYLLSLKQPPLPNCTTAQAGDGKSSPAVAPTKPDVTPAAVSASSSATAANSSSFDTAKGQQLYTANCAACHQAGGTGLPGAFPPLKGNAVVNDADPAMHIHTVLFGLRDAVIDGAKYASPMPAFGNTLSDADIANIIDHERSSWGNHGTPVTAAQVSAMRAKGK